MFGDSLTIIDPDGTETPAHGVATAPHTMTETDAGRENRVTRLRVRLIGVTDVRHDATIRLEDGEEYSIDTVGRIVSGYRTVELMRTQAHEVARDGYRK